MSLAFSHTITTARLTLRPMTVADAPRVVEIQSNWNVARMLRVAPYPPTLDGIRDWLAQHPAEWRAGTAYRFGVLAGDRLVGCADVDEIAAGTGELGYWLDEACWGRGYAREAAAAVRDFAFDKIGLKRLLSGHAADNLASGRVLATLGFAWTGHVTVWSRSRGQFIRHRTYRLAAPRAHQD